VGRGPLIHVDPLKYINLLGDLIRVEGVERGLVRLKLSQIVPVHHAIFLDALKDNHASSSVTHRQQLTLFVIGDGTEDVLLCDIRWIGLT
jgi:hypothetical protein